MDMILRSVGSSVANMEFATYIFNQLIFLKVLRVFTACEIIWFQSTILTDLFPVTLRENYTRTKIHQNNIEV